MSYNWHKIDRQKFDKISYINGMETDPNKTYDPNLKKYMNDILNQAEGEYDQIHWFMGKVNSNTTQPGTINRELPVLVLTNSSKDWKPSNNSKKTLLLAPCPPFCQNDNLHD